ncbi:MAG: acyl-homoserine-lactone synthase [Pseudomonadota bacterium]
MPITIVRSTGPADDRALRGMFAARKQVFVDLLRWDLPVLDDAYEIDQFDDGHAIYLMVTDRGGQHLGSARLLPTSRPYLLHALFPMLCEGELPTADDCWEITRFCLDRGLRADERLGIRNALIHALAVHALEAGIRTYVGVAELAWLQQILAFGWRCRPLGFPQPVGGRTLGALEIDIDQETLELLAANGIGDAQPLAAAA